MEPERTQPFLQGVQYFFFNLKKVSVTALILFVIVTANIVTSNTVHEYPLPHLAEPEVDLGSYQDCLTLGATQQQPFLSLSFCLTPCLFVPLSQRLTESHRKLLSAALGAV